MLQLLIPLVNDQGRNITVPSKLRYHSVDVHYNKKKKWKRENVENHKKKMSDSDINNDDNDKNEISDWDYAIKNYKNL